MPKPGGYVREKGASREGFYITDHSGQYQTVLVLETLEEENSLLRLAIRLFMAKGLEKYVPKPRRST